jgi:outer membrane protein OmpA-like peptidoglycan-associated protein
MKKINFLICTALMGFSALQAQHIATDSVQVQVSVTDFKNNVRTKDIVIFEGKTTHKTFRGITNSNGSFDISLPKGDTYLIKIKSLGEAQEFNTLTVPNIEGRLAKARLSLKYEEPKSFTLNNVYYEFGKAGLRKESFKELNELVEVMQLKTNLEIEIAGYTDNIGEESDNLKLSQLRSESVKNYLISKGIPAKRIAAKGFGESFPVASNEDETSRAKNRRTEVIITKQ